MIRIKFYAAVAAALVISMPALADCTLPPPPSKIPNGSTASEQEMLAAMNTLKEYNGDVNVYLKCLDYEVKQNRMPASVRDAKNNSAVTELQTVADKFNQQVRAFKAKHG
ncbi:MAG TPA: hypothetical protein VN730_10250 [Steroidobacteraceae bacterium]|nr:hypothetical protein [Steroidobacteraceae bacterium]